MINNIIFMEIKQTPNVENARILLSADSFLWDVCPNIGLIEDICFDRYCQPILNADGYATQLKNAKNIKLIPENAFGCFICVEDIFYTELIQGAFTPNKLVYDELTKDLVLVGYEIVTKDFQSYSVYGQALTASDGVEVNEYSLINSYEKAKNIQHKANALKESKFEWEIVAICVDKYSNLRLKKFLNTAN
jgi:hypothetical protein